MKNINFYISLTIHIIIAWATVFVASMKDGMTNTQIAIMIGSMLLAGGNAALAHMKNPDGPLTNDQIAGIKKSLGVVSLVIVAVILSGCAHSTFYVDGKRVAAFQGDMTKQHFLYKRNGVTIVWNADTISHSAATLAQGQAAHEVIGAAATLSTATGIAVATSGALPGGIGALIHRAF